MKGNESLPFNKNAPYIALTWLTYTPTLNFGDANDFINLQEILYIKFINGQLALLRAIKAIVVDIMGRIDLNPHKTTTQFKSGIINQLVLDKIW